ncbi:MAG: SxtJ family membrane protein [Vicinamibacterales bacterium]
MMHWSDVTTPPSQRTLRQFAAMWLLLFGGAALWRLSNGDRGTFTTILGVFGFGLGTAGLWLPSIMRYIFTGWMIVAFPVGWTVSRIALALTFFGVFTPVALLFRLNGRDALGLHKDLSGGSYWRRAHPTQKASDYLRQF